MDRKLIPDRSSNPAPRGTDGSKSSWPSRGITGRRLVLPGALPHSTGAGVERLSRDPRRIARAPNRAFVRADRARRSAGFGDCGFDLRNFLGGRDFTPSGIGHQAWRSPRQLYACCALQAFTRSCGCMEGAVLHPSGKGVATGGTTGRRAGCRDRLLSKHASAHKTLTCPSAWTIFGN